jgi:hypothetical protein
MLHLGLEFTLGKVMQSSGGFSLPGKKHLYEPSSRGSVLLVDVTECPIERPKKTAIVLQWQATVA